MVKDMAAPRHLMSARISDLSRDSLRVAWQAVSRASIIYAESARAVRHYLEQTACHHHVFYEVKRLVGIGKARMKEYRCGQAKHNKYGGDDSRAIAHDDEEATTDLDGDSSYIGNGWGQGERRGFNQRNRRVVAHDFAYSTHHEWQADEQTANEGEISRSAHNICSDFSVHLGGGPRGARPSRAANRVHASAIDHVHGDFHAEAKLGGLRSLPSHFNVLSCRTRLLHRSTLRISAI
jgi:hypothetical protein